MPELAEVAYFLSRWKPGLGEKITKVEAHAHARVLRGTDTKKLAAALTGAKLERLESRGKQMLVVAKPRKGARAWMGVHLGMTGEMRVEKAGYAPKKHDHLVLQQAKRALVFEDARMFGRILFAQAAEAPEWWTKQAPDLLSREFTEKALSEFLKRRKSAPIKAVLLMQERFRELGTGWRTRFCGGRRFIRGRRRGRWMRR